jgi:hypothetical protein
MLQLTRVECENAASVLGIKPATRRQWRHRRDIIFVNPEDGTRESFIRKIFGGRMEVISHLVNPSDPTAA